MRSPVTQADFALDPISAFVVFPAGRRPSQKARVFADYLEGAIASSQISSFEREAGGGPSIEGVRP